MAKLLCPHCEAKVTIGDDIIARHPMVRCSKCQGAIPVATSRVKESAPKRSRKLKRKSTFPVGLVVAGGLGLVLVLAIVITLVLVLGRGDQQAQKTTTQANQPVPQQPIQPQPFQPQPAQKDNAPPAGEGAVTRASLMMLADQRDAIFDQMVVVMENLRTEADAEPAIEKLTKLFPEYQRLVKDIKEKSTDLPTEEFAEFIGDMTARTMGLMQKSDRRLDAAARRIESNAALMKKLRQLGMRSLHLGDQGVFHKGP